MRKFWNSVKGTWAVMVIALVIFGVGGGVLSAAFDGLAFWLTYMPWLAAAFWFGWSWPTWRQARSYARF